MWTYAPYVAIALINSLAVLCYSISSFGQAIVFHLGWQVCKTVAAPKVCSGGISIVVIHVTMAALFLFPSQLWMLRKWVNWSLACHLAVCQQIGLYAGMFVLFGIESVWMSRALGLLFLIIALQMIIVGTPSSAGSVFGSGIVLQSNISDDEHEAESHPPFASGDAASFDSYKVDTWSRRVAVWSTGLASGICSGLFATGGPPVMVFVSAIKLNSLECRATMAFCDLCQNMGRFIFILFFQKKLEILTGKYTLTLLTLTGTSTICLVVGNEISKRINQKVFHRLLALLLIGGAVMFLINGCNYMQTIVVSSCAFLVAMFAVVVTHVGRYCKIRRITLEGTLLGDNSEEHSESTGLAMGTMSSGGRSSGSSDSNNNSSFNFSGSSSSSSGGRDGKNKKKKPVDSIGGVDALEDITSVVMMPMQQKSQTWNFEILSGKIYAAINSKDEDEEAAVTVGESVLF